jgi:DNA-binding MarR family transcriptional regulator
VGEQQRDVVDRIVEQWSRSSPDVDVSPIEVIGRISRASRIIDQRLSSNFAAHGIEAWMYDVLATLRRIGAPYELTAGDLVRRTMVTTGAMTNRIDRLEERGYVVRVPSTVDRRSVTVRLTAAGVEKVDQVAAAHYELERTLLGGLTPAHREDLKQSLRLLLVSLGDTDSTESP